MVLVRIAPGAGLRSTAAVSDKFVTRFQRELQGTSGYDFDINSCEIAGQTVQPWLGYCRSPRGVTGCPRNRVPVSEVILSAKVQQFYLSPRWSGSEYSVVQKARLKLSTHRTGSSNG